METETCVLLAFLGPHLHNTQTFTCRCLKLVMQERCHLASHKVKSPHAAYKGRLVAQRSAVNFKTHSWILYSQALTSVVYRLCFSVSNAPSDVKTHSAPQG